MVDRVALAAMLDNLSDATWNEAQFAMTSRLQGESASIAELHCTPGAPRNVQIGAEYCFWSSRGPTTPNYLYNIVRDTVHITGLFGCAVANLVVFCRKLALVIGLNYDESFTKLRLFPERQRLLCRAVISWAG